jgi:hypothetical protein
VSRREILRRKNFRKTFQNTIEGLSEKDTKDNIEIVFKNKGIFKRKICA